MKPVHELSEDELFDSWQKEIENQPNRSSYCFCKDGIISPDDWNNTDTKILFILKEGRSQSDIRRTIFNSLENSKSGWRRHKVLRRVGRWAYGLMHRTSTIPDFDEARKHQFKSPRQIAYINISKTPGGKSTKPRFLDEETKKYAAYIKRQIDIIDPDIVVLCGVYWVIKKHVYQEGMKRLAHRIHGVPRVPRVHKDDNRIFIHANHPAARKKAKELYEQVVCSYHAYKSGAEKCTTPR